MRYPKPLMAVLAVILSLSLAAMACGGGAAQPTDTPQPTKAPKATSTTAALVAPTKAPEPTATEKSTTGGGGSGEVTILNSSSYVDYYNYIHVVGLLNNDTNKAITSIELTIELRDKDGNSVLKDYDDNSVESLTFSPALYTLAPGQNSPFDWYVSGDDIDPDEYVVTVSGYNTGDVDRPEAGLEIENAQMITDDDGNLFFTGELVNLSDTPVLINAFAGAATDDDGNVLASDYTFAITRYLYPAGDEGGNDRTPFLVTMDGPVDNFTNWAAYWDADIADEMDPSGLDIEITSNYYDTYDYYHLVGTVTNNGDETLYVSLVAGLYASDGTVIDASTGSVPVYVAPGETAPWHIQYFAALNNSSTGAADVYDRYTVQIDRHWTYETSYDIVVLESANDDVGPGSDGIIEAKGDVTNSSDKELSSIAVVVIILDENEVPVAMEWTSIYPEGDSIAKGDTNSFDVSVYLDPDWDTSNYTFQTIIQGYVK